MTPAILSAALLEPVPERRALRMVALAIAWPPAEARQAMLRTLAADADWALVLATAERHRVVGLAAHGLAMAGVAMPEPAGARVRARAAAVAIAELSCAGEACRLDAALRGAGIAPITLKGVAVAMQAFGRLGLRQNHDIDLLVAPAEMEAALAVLARAGYAPVAAPDPRDARRPWSRRPKDTPLLHGRSGLMVELHHRLFENAFLMPLEAPAGVPARAGVALPGGAGLETLGFETMLVYLATHAAQHLWSRLKWLADIQALVARRTDDEVRACYDEADRRGGRRMLSATLLLCALLFEAPPRAEALRDWGRDVRLRTIVRLAIRLTIASGPRELESIRFGSTRKNLAHYLLRGSPRYLLRELAFDLGDASNVAVPAQIAWLGPLARPLAWGWQRIRTRGVWTDATRLSNGLIHNGEDQRTG